MGEVRKWFDTIDVNRDGSLAAAELQRALSLGNLTFSLAFAAHLIRLFDQHDCGAVTYDEFQKLHAFLTGLQATYDRLDGPRRGGLSQESVSQALQDLGYRLDPPALQTLFKAFDPDRSGRVGLAGFMAMNVFMRSASATFQAFDPQRQGTIHLSFNQWVYAAANVL